MLEHLGEHLAQAILESMEKVPAAGVVRTPDLGGTATTNGVANAVDAQTQTSLSKYFRL